MTASERTQRKKNSGWRFLRDVVIIVAIAFIVSFVVKTFIVRSFFIPSASMERTLLIDDHVLVNEIGPRLTGIARGDVAVFRDPGGWLGEAETQTKDPTALTSALQAIGLVPESGDEYLVKRVIGQPGDRVECCDDSGRVSVNGVSIDEPYVQVPSGMPASGSDFSTTVPDGHLWVMGDNRYNSADSRAHQDTPTHGFVPIDDVVGTAFVINWPISRFSLLTDYSGVFSTVPAGRPATISP